MTNWGPPGLPTGCWQLCVISFLVVKSNFENVIFKHQSLVGNCKGHKGRNHYNTRCLCSILMDSYYSNRPCDLESLCLHEIAEWFEYSTDAMESKDKRFSQIENMQWLPSAEIKAWLMKYPKLTWRNLENKHLIIPQHTAHPELWQRTFFLGELARGRNFPLLSFLKTVVWISEFNEKSKLGKG